LSGTVIHVIEGRFDRASARAERCFDAFVARSSARNVISIVKNRRRIDALGERAKFVRAFAFEQREIAAERAQLRA